MSTPISTVGPVRGWSGRKSDGAIAERGDAAQAEPTIQDASGIMLTIFAIILACIVTVAVACAVVAGSVYVVIAVARFAGAARAGTSIKPDRSSS